MMSKEANERLKRDTQHVPLSQNAEEKGANFFLSGPAHGRDAPQPSKDLRCCGVHECDEWRLSGR